MSRARRSSREHAPEHLARVVTEWSGRSSAFGLAAGIVVTWALLGPVFGFSDTWQLVVNTGTTIVTFLMVFLIQRSQNKEARAMELKLNELIAAVHGASNRLIDVENLSEREIETLHRHYAALVRMAREDAELTASHSIEEAYGRHRAKVRETK
jgi:low affinity Fe/Cu permease